jgi:crotonobetainyl-CoA:carnitine CoA-transferase CaiB-like acyl-CoA transferase
MVRDTPTDEVLHDPQALRSGAVAEFTHPVYGSLRVVGNLIRLSNVPAGERQLPPPLVGEHTREILDELGYAPGETAALEDGGVVVQAPQ